MPRAVIPREGELLPLRRGFPPWKWGLPHGGCRRSALPWDPRTGWLVSQELKRAGGSGHEQRNG